MTRRWASVTLSLLLAAASPAHADDPVSSSVRFNREIIRILDRKCLPCHASETIGMSLATYRDARPWARAIREELVEHRMPPWSAAPGSVRFTGDIGLTPRELTTLLTWLDGGLPRGDEADLPRPVAAHIEAAGLTLPLPPQTVAGSPQDFVRRISVVVPGAVDRWVRQVRIRPGDRRVVRAAFAWIGGSASPQKDASQVWAAAWTPWQAAIEPPEGAAFLLRAGSRLVVELHYRGGEQTAVDRSSVELLFAPQPRPDRVSTILLVPQPAGAGRWTGSRTLLRPTTVWGLRPVGLANGQSFEVTATAPDGRRDVLLWVPTYRADWPAPFIFAKPLLLASGTRLKVTSTGGHRPTSAALAVIGP